MKNTLENIKWEINYFYRTYILLPIREVKWFYQRGKRGWADCDAWEMNDYLSEVIIGLLEKKIKEDVGYPTEFKSEKEWKSQLIKMASGFHAWQLFHEDDFWYDPNATYAKNRQACIKADKEARQSLEKSFKLLSKHYVDLWD